jgi:hypothetical protein
MPHVTFIHGIANKPPKERLHEIWLRSLATGADPLDLEEQGVTSSMVYWADVLYDSPEEALASNESAGEIDLEAVEKDPAIGNVVLQPQQLEEKLWVASLAAKLAPGVAITTAENHRPPEEEADGSFERVPLPWFIKQRFLKTFLRDVHHYLFDATSALADGRTFEVQKEIRRRFVEALKQPEAAAGPHVVVSHSMGTVIAYDCLKRVVDRPHVDALMTIGSPLGFDEIQDKLQPGWTRPDGFPSEKVEIDWVNIFDHLDPVAAFDPFLCSDFRKEGREVVIDIHEPNYGHWRHDLSKYFGGPKLRNELRRRLRL